MKRLLCFIVLFTIIITVTYYISLPHMGPSRSGRIDRAVGYLKSHFNDDLGLIYESEDAGVRVVNQREYRCNQVYWVYSDNLLAAWALKPYDPVMTERINQTISSYNLPSSNLYEVLFGETIPRNISIPVQVVVEQHPDWVVMAEFHNSTKQLQWWRYADTLIYQSINEYLRGNRSGAEQYFYKAYEMWDGKGLYDLATQTDGKYANYKLALIPVSYTHLTLPTTPYV